MDATMQIVGETFETRMRVAWSTQLVAEESGPINYHCGECGALLVRHASAHLPDVIVMCPICRSLNEVVPEYALTRPEY